MIDFSGQYARFQAIRGDLGGLPGWGRTVVMAAAVPGIVLVLLSLLALGVSILALLLLTVPAYRLMKGLAGIIGGNRGADEDRLMSESGRRQVNARIVE